MKGSWRDRPTGSWFSRLWRPWVSLNPFRGRGRSINEPKPVGIRDLVASPDEVQIRPERRWRVIGGFFLCCSSCWSGGCSRCRSSTTSPRSRRWTRIRFESRRSPPSRGLILDRNGTPLVTNVTTTEIRLSRAEAALYPPIKGALASLTGLSVKQINSDLDNLQYDPYQPAPILSNAPAKEVEFIKLHPSEFPGVSVLDVSTRSYPNGGNIGAQVLGYVGPITGAGDQGEPGPALPDGLDHRKDGHRGLLRAVPARPRRHQHPRGRRLREHLGRSPHHRAHRRRLGGAQHRHRPAEGARRLPRERHPSRAPDPGSDERHLAAGDQRRRHRARSEQRRRAGGVELPVVRPELVHQRALEQGLSPTTERGGIQQLRDPGSLHAGQHLQDDLRYCRTADRRVPRRQVRRRHRVVQGPELPSGPSMRLP